MKTENLFFKQAGTTTKTAAEKIEICKTNLIALVDFNAGKEVIFTDLKGRTSKVKKGMIQSLPIGSNFENAKLVGISYAAGSDAKTPKFKDAEGDEHLVHNFTGWWAPATGTMFSDKKTVRQYSIFTGK